MGVVLNSSLGLFVRPQSVASIVFSLAALALVPAHRQKQQSEWKRYMVVVLLLATTVSGDPVGL